MPNILSKCIAAVAFLATGGAVTLILYKMLKNRAPNAGERYTQQTDNVPSHGQAGVEGVQSAKAEFPVTIAHEMAAKTPLVLRLVATSVAVAHRAGNIIRDILKKGELGIVEKGVNDVQTEADRSAQRCIMASLHHQYPDVSVIGEEDLDPNDVIPKDYVENSLSAEVLKFADSLPTELKNVKDEDVVVWVDPLDGTAEYTQGLLDHVTVLIGIAVRGKAVGGVIYQPYYNYKAGPGVQLGRSIWGVIGVGSVGVSQRKPPQHQNIIATTKWHMTADVMRAVKACSPTEIIQAGGAGHKVLLLLEGKAHAYVFASPGCKKWDTCAPEAVLHAAGGKLTDIHGNNFQYHKTVAHRNSAGVLGTPGSAEHKWYQDKIPESVKQALPVK